MNFRDELTSAQQSALYSALEYQNHNLITALARQAIISATEVTKDMWAESDIEAAPDANDIRNRAIMTMRESFMETIRDIENTIERTQFTVDFKRKVESNLKF